MPSPPRVRAPPSSPAPTRGPPGSCPGTSCAIWWRAARPASSASASRAATAWWPICPTDPRPSSRSSPRPASARSGPRARRSSGCRACSTGSASSPPPSPWSPRGYRYGEKEIDRTREVEAILAGLPTVSAVVDVDHGWDDLLSETGRARLRAGALRPSALRAVLVGDDRATQGHRPRSRRHPPRAPQGARAAPRPRPGRPLLLVLHHRLDDVEPVGVGPLRRRHDRAVRRRSRLARPREAVADGG